MLAKFGILSMATVALAVHPSIFSRKVSGVEIVPGTTDQRRDLTAAEAHGALLQGRKEDNPTYGDHTGSTSSYTDGSGTYVNTKDVYRYASGDKCWTDLFYVKSYMTSDSWERNGDIDCATTSECERGIQNDLQTCASWSIEQSVSAELSLIEDFLSVGASTTVSYGGEECKTISTTADCHWDDEGCHAVWTSKNVQVNQGYIRRRCNFGHGDQTVWSLDLDVRAQASGINLGCKASCSDSSYPA